MAGIINLFTKDLNDEKSIIASVVALDVVSGLAQAAVNEVQFEGNVTTVSCELTSSVDNSKGPNGVGVIRLGMLQYSKWNR